MTQVHAALALLPEGWRRNVRLAVGSGKFHAVETGVEDQSSDERYEIVIPGMPDLHSHAFQRGMAGLTETRGPGPDSFWTWRSLMYRFALSMDPEQVEAVAAQVYMEMLEAGFSRVGEFHYLHHAPDGQPYDNVCEMALRIVSASIQTGIRLTLLPVFYAHSGFGGQTPTEGQCRFINGLDQFARLLEGCRDALRTFSGSVVGVAPHSLRAVTPLQLKEIIDLAGQNPIHIHVAEQHAEVEACKTWSGARPVEWLLDNAPVDKRWCLIHATHMTGYETQRMARSGAIAGLCPVTEANLGDGVFNAGAFISEGGAFGIGSDSNVLIGIDHELRQLEYSQRLTQNARNVLASPKKSTGRFLFESAVSGGRKALLSQKALQGQETGLIAGGDADFVSLTRKDAPHLNEDSLLDGWIFANSAEVDSVWINGRKRVVKGRHLDRDRISRQFRKVMQVLVG
jgi:formimidoylglutamate deiminase